MQFLRLLLGSWKDAATFLSRNNDPVSRCPSPRVLVECVAELRCGEGGGLVVKTAAKNWSTRNMARYLGDEARLDDPLGRVDGVLRLVYTMEQSSPGDRHVWRPTGERSVTDVMRLSRCQQL